MSNHHYQENLYLLDANSLFTSIRITYRIEAFPQVWDFLSLKAFEGIVKVPQEIYAEIMRGSKEDKTLKWIGPQKDNFLLASDFTQENFEIAQSAYTYNVSTKLQGDALNEQEIVDIGADIFLTSYALDKRLAKNITIITEEKSEPKKTRQNKKIPDICDYLGIRHIKFHEFLTEQSFNARNSYTLPAEFDNAEAL